MPAYNAELDKFAGYDAQVVGIGVDSVFSHIAWQKYEIGMLRFPLCSDFWPHGDTARKFGVLREGDPIPGISDLAVANPSAANRTVYFNVTDNKLVEQNAKAAKNGPVSSSGNYSFAGIADQYWTSEKIS